jgi:hypothetical protein
MLSRLLAILVCISLLGVTVVPASFMPCCCKVGVKLVRGHQQSGACCAARSGESVSTVQPEKRSCCSAVKAAALPSCLARKALKPECRTCRCLEQAQIMALSGHSFYQVCEKIPLLATISDCSSASVITERGVELGEDHSAPGITVFLKTCAFLI